MSPVLGCNGLTESQIQAEPKVMHCGSRRNRYAFLIQVQLDRPKQEHIVRCHMKLQRPEIQGKCCTGCRWSFAEHPGRRRKRKDVSELVAPTDCHCAVPRSIGTGFL